MVLVYRERECDLLWGGQHVLHVTHPVALRSDRMHVDVRIVVREHRFVLCGKEPTISMVRPSKWKSL